MTEHILKNGKALAWPMGKLYEVALNVEGYQSSGYADVYKNNLTIGGSTSGGSTGGSSSGGNTSRVEAAVLEWAHGTV